MWLIKTSSDTDCILTFSLGLSVPTLRRFCRLRSTILPTRYDTCFSVILLPFIKSVFLLYLVSIVSVPNPLLLLNSMLATTLSSWCVFK